MNDNASSSPDVPLTPLFLWQGGWLMVMPAIDNQPHQHVAASLLVGLSQPLRVTVDGRPCQQQVVLVPPDVPQSLNSQGPVAVVHLDPDEPAWRALSRLGGLDDRQQRWCCAQIAALVRNGSEENARLFLQGLRALADPLPLDPRIADACRRMRAAEAKWPAGRTESRKQYIARLRRTAFGLPASFINKSIVNMQHRCKRLHEARGGHFEEGGKLCR